MKATSIKGRAKKLNNYTFAAVNIKKIKIYYTFEIMNG